MQDLDKNALDRWITGNYGEDQFRDGDDDDWDETDEEEWLPEEDDGYVFGTTLGTEASFAGKNLGVFEDEDSAREAIKAEGKRSGFWPNVWSVSDHGNHHLIENFWND